VLSFVACDCILNVLTTFMASILDPLDYDQVHLNKHLIHCHTA
jgi:hypothetical protein